MIDLACASLCAEGFQDGGFERTFAMIPAAGYRYVEFNLWFGRMLLPDVLQDLRRRCSEAGLDTAAVYFTDLGLLPNRIDIDVAHKLYGLQVARALDCTRLVIPGAPRGSGGSLEAAIQTLSLIAPAAADQGVVICLENHTGFTIDTIEDYERIFTAVPHENIGICMDTGHFDASGVSMDGLIDRLGSRVLHFHVKENREWGRKDFCRFGEGTTDNAHVIERMIGLGFEGFITIEQSPQSDRDTSIEDLRKPYEMFKQYIRQE